MSASDALHSFVRHDTTRRRTHPAVALVLHVQSTDSVRRGFFGKGDMQVEFEQASFGLKPGEVSLVIETQSGLHIIER